MQELYFAYGTLKAGFPNHAAFADVLSEGLGSFRTRAPFPLVVPNAPACPNPGCSLVHRIGALVDREGDGARVEGELYAVSAATLARLDALEGYDPQDAAGSAYRRRRVEVEPTGGGACRSAWVYFIAQPEDYLALLAEGAASAVSRYTLDMATGEPKPCCQVDPQHDGPHDVLPLR